ncbi:MAG: polysaccharide biosynthesis C-terminal domain-containing protein, partial [Ignavibacteria bacterium]|nr:polysaccharide biosynthesis C-terminal domain-containing protein [Ignavibacteria bacterium]
MGAAVATLLSYISMTVGIYFTSRKFYRIDYQKPKLISIAVILSVSIVIYYATRTIDSLLIDIGSFLLILSSFFLFRIIDISTVKRFLK